MRQKAEEEESRRLEFEKEKEEREEAAKAKKTDDLWADFLKDTAPPAAAAASAAAKPDQSVRHFLNCSGAQFDNFGTPSGLLQAVLGLLRSST